MFAIEAWGARDERNFAPLFPCYTEEPFVDRAQVSAVGPIGPLRATGLLRPRSRARAPSTRPSRPYPFLKVPSLANRPCNPR